MIKSFTITNYLGNSIKMSLHEPELSGFIIRSVSGLGPAKANVNTTEISTNDGSLFNSAWLTNRNIVFELIFTQTVNGESIEDIRQKSYKFFPMKKQVEILVETDNRTIKAKGHVESNEPNIFSDREGAQISIICPDPYFYSEGADVTVFYGIEAAFHFPFSNESLTEPLIVFGYIQNKTENVITYNGDSEIGITIRIHAIGDVSNVTIYNTGTRESMRIDTGKLKELTQYGLIAGDDIIITTSKGEKGIILVRRGKSTNIMNCLEKGTDWFTLVKGDNIFAFAAESGTTNLQFWIENKVIYEGA